MVRYSKVSKSLCSLLLVFTTNFSLDTQTIFGNLQCRKFNCSSCRCLYRIKIFVVVLFLIYPNIIPSAVLAALVLPGIVLCFFSGQLSQQYFVEIWQQFLWTALTAIFGELRQQFSLGSFSQQYFGETRQPFFSDQL